MRRETVAEPTVDRVLGRYGGVVVAGLGFLVTRLLVVEAVTLSASPLVVAATVVPLVVGLGLTVAGTGASMFGGPFGTRLLVANVVLGGAVGGIVNGHRKASVRERTEVVMRGANRARFINRLLRHEVLNAATIIDGSRTSRSSGSSGTSRGKRRSVPDTRFSADGSTDVVCRRAETGRSAVGRVVGLPDDRGDRGRSVGHHAVVSLGDAIGDRLRRVP